VGGGGRGHVWRGGEGKEDRTTAPASGLTAVERGD